MSDYNEKLDFVIRSVLSRKKTMLPEDVRTELCVEIEAFIQARDRELGELESCIEMTDEVAIEHLQRSGWLQKHEELLTVDSVAAIVNRIMRDGDKTISVNVYPWKEENDD